MYDHLGDFIADLYDFFDWFAEADPAWAPQGRFIKKAHLFDLGDIEALDAYLDNAVEDIVEEIMMADGIPLPFDNISLVMRHGEELEFVNISRASINPQLRKNWLDEALGFDPGRSYCITRFSTVSEYGEVFGMTKYGYNGPLSGAFEPFLVVEFGGVEGGNIGGAVHVAQSHPVGLQIAQQMPEGLEAYLSGMVADVLSRTAGISHPGHYIVEVKPKGPKTTASKNPKKRRRAQRNIDHFILVSYDEVTRLNPSNRGTSGQTVRPHARRGHWRELPERAVHKRAEGITRVFVRPALIGPHNFEDRSNKYRVLPPVLSNVTEA
jgi:hypothetical protein